MSLALTPDDGPSPSPAERGTASPTVVARMEEALAEADCAAIRERRERIEKAEAIQREARAKTAELFGAERYEHWRAFVAGHWRARIARGLPPHDGDALLAEDRERRGAAESEGAALLKDWGIEAEALRAVATEAGDRIIETLSPVRAEVDDGITIRPGPMAPLSHDDDAPLITNLAMPPYAGQGGSTSPASDGPFTRTVTDHTSSQTGALGQTLRVQNSDAGDHDFIAAVDDRFVQHGVFMPQSGKLAVSIQLTVLGGSNRVTIIDEYGTSQCDVLQQHDLTFRVVGPSGATSTDRQLMFRGRFIRNSLFHKLFEPFEQGSTLVAGFVGQPSFQQGDFVMYEIGSRATNEVFTNDMEVDSKVSYRFRVDQVLTGVIHL